MNLRISGCPNSQCSNKTIFKKDGSYFRKNDSRYIQRFKCIGCGRRFSKATFDLECHQKKRRVNFPLLKLLSSGVSQRRSALILRVNPKTIARKLSFLAIKYGGLNQRWLDSLEKESIEHLQLDDLITTEHTKLKPLSVSAIIDPKTRKIFVVEVARIPAFGNLAALSRRKYGYRENQHPEAFKRAVHRVLPLLAKDALIESDEHHLYQKVIKKLLPTAEHLAYKGGRGAVTGQGELKKLKFDPLFGINHTYAMFRANINRLFRKTWCTTKRVDKLKEHLEVYIWYHNNVLINN